MPKINPNLLPAPKERRVLKVAAPVPGQGEFTLFLRRPEFSELLKIGEEIKAKTAEFEKTGNWYPSNPPVQPSESLWQLVIPALLLQVTETGDELPPDEKYVEQELVPIIGRVPEAYYALAQGWSELAAEAQGDLGNGLTAAEVSPSLPASNTDNSTRT